jgi:membrane protein DedA with SNARE-associated domain
MVLADHAMQAIHHYGYGAVALAVGLESIGVPLPGEATLVAAAIYAGTTGRLDIALVIVAAAGGAIVGDNIGFWIGREAGFRLLRRYGPYVRLTPERLRLGHWLFRRHGGKVVFFGRFVSILRTFAALLAGANRMTWPHFLFYNAAGGIVWATLYGLGAFFLGQQLDRIAGPVGIALAAVAVAALAAAFLFLRKNEARLEDEALRAEEAERKRGRR